MKKRIYISPVVSFEELEHESPLCDASVFGPDQPGEELPEAKRGCLSLGDELIGPIEAANNNFEFTLDF